MPSEIRKRTKSSNDESTDKKKNTRVELDSRREEEKRRVRPNQNITLGTKSSQPKDISSSASTKAEDDVEIASGSYWLTRVLYLRYLAFIYCKCQYVNID